MSWNRGCAEMLLARAGEKQSPQADRDRAQAQVEATLAVETAIRDLIDELREKS